MTGKPQTTSRGGFSTRSLTERLFILFPGYPFSWSTYRVFEEWLKELPNPLPRTVKRLKVSGFEAVSLPADNTGGGTPIRDTWIGVPENTTGRGRVYRFMLMGAPSLWESEARL